MIDVSRTDRVAHLVINAPPVNVLDSTVLAELTSLVNECARDDGLAAILLSGEGKCFSAGASLADHHKEKAPAMLTSLLDACTSLADCPVPVVALVHGACLGGATELISFCDFVVADPDAKLGQPEIKLAFFPPVAAYQLPRLIGLQNAAYTVLTGDDLDAERARDLGLVQKILAKDEWKQMETLFNRLSAPVVRLTKASLRRGGGEYDRGRLEELRTMFLEELYALEDVEEGIKSFEERRRPEWKHG
jgi:cyclohexa-1,5-dienecarbonyl-CoA hydratase